VMAGSSPSAIQSMGWCNRWLPEYVPWLLASLVGVTVKQ
jgi:hypothetical protein